MNWTSSDVCAASRIRRCDSISRLGRQARTSAQITLVAEVANAYLTWEANQELVTLAQATLKSPKEMEWTPPPARASERIGLERLKQEGGFSNPTASDVPKWKF